MDSSKNLLLIGLSRDPERGSDDEAEKMAESSPSDDAIDEMFGHWKSGDHRAARAAFKSAVRICSLENDSDDTMKEEEGY